MHNMSRISGPLNRISVINALEEKHGLTRVITENLCHYMENARHHREGNRKKFIEKNSSLRFFVETKKIIPPDDYYPDGRFNHNQQIQERLLSLK